MKCSFVRVFFQLQVLFTGNLKGTSSSLQNQTTQIHQPRDFIIMRFFQKKKKNETTADWSHLINVHSHLDKQLPQSTSYVYCNETSCTILNLKLGCQIKIMFKYTRGCQKNAQTNTKHRNGKEDNKNTFFYYSRSN